jgi:cytochrome c oxidase cbb3-type subunit III
VIIARWALTLWALTLWALTLWALTLWACVPRGEARAGRSAQAPEQAAPAAADAGKPLYARYCQLCHAADGTGYAADNAPSLVSPNFLASASDAFLDLSIRLGRSNSAMAAYGQSQGGPLDDAEIAAIVAFLLSHAPPAAPLPELPVTGNAARGAELFTEQCESCHGTLTDRGTAPQLLNPELLAAASPAFLRHAIVHGRPPTPMPAFEARLTPSQIDDIVAWLTGSRTRPQARRPRARLEAPTDLPVVIHPRGNPAELRLRDDRFVSAEQLEQALEQKQRLIIIDARTPSDFIQFHIPGAIPIPYYDTAKLDRVPNDGTWVIAYCACPHHASGEVVDALRSRGYPHTAVLDEGILFWRKQGYPLEGEALGPRTTPAAR